MGGIRADYRQQQQQRKQIGNRNNNNNDDDCNTTNLIDLQDVCSKQVRPFRFAVGFYNKGGDGDEGPVIIRFQMLYQYQYRQQQQNRLPTMERMLSRR